MSTHRGYEDMPVHIQEAVDTYRRVHGQKVPLNNAEARSNEAGSTTNHPYDSMMDDAEPGVIGFFDISQGTNEHEEYGQVINRNIVDDPDIMTDGGYEFEHMEVFSEGHVEGEDIAAQASEYAVEVYDFAEEGVAIAGDRGDVNRFVGEIRQQLGAHKTEYFFNESVHDKIPKPETGTMSPYNGHNSEASEIDQEETPNCIESESDQEIVTDGGSPNIPGTSLGGYNRETSHEDFDPEGKMGM